MKKLFVLIMLVGVFSLLFPLSVATAHVEPCPPGWSLGPAQGPTDPFDKNGNGVICEKDIPGEGLGNSGQRQGAEEVGHVPGHNEKDDHVH